MNYIWTIGVINEWNLVECIIRKNHKLIDKNKLILNKNMRVVVNLLSSVIYIFIYLIFF